MASYLTTRADLLARGGGMTSGALLTRDLAITIGSRQNALATALGGGGGGEAGTPPAAFVRSGYAMTRGEADSTLSLPVKLAIGGGVLAALLVGVKLLKKKKR